MADEIAQVLELEFKGTKLLIEATVQTGQLVARMMYSLFKWSEKMIEKRADKNLNKAGEKSMSEIIKLSEGPAAVLQVRDINAISVLAEASKHGLHFSVLTDFNPADGLMPIFVPAQEMPMWAEIIKAYTTQQKIEDEKVKKEYEKEIAEEKEKLQNAKTPEEKEKIETRIENYTQAQEEIQRWIDYENGVIEKGDTRDSSNDIVEYLKQSKGTDFELNPEKAMAELEQGVEIGRKFSVKECLQPVRDKSYIPEKSVMFYIPDIGAAVTRTYHIDKETGLVYSNYQFKTKDGEIHKFTDHNMTSAKWNTTYLPELMDKANLLEETQCRLFDSQEKLEAYLKYHNNVKTEAEKNVEKAIENKEPVFSSAEAKSEIENAISEKKKGLASASIVSDKVKIAVEPEMLTRQSGKLILNLKNGETLMFSGFANEGIEKGKMVFEIEKDATVLHVKAEGTALEPNKVLGEECMEIITNAMSESNVVSQTLKTSQKR